MGETNREEKEQDREREKIRNGVCERRMSVDKVNKGTNHARIWG